MKRNRIFHFGTFSKLNSASAREEKKFSLKPVFSFGKHSNSKRELRFENLEDRRLLAVSTAEYEALTAIYSELDWSVPQNELALIEITAENLSETALQEAILAAQESEMHDLIILRTSENSRTIELSETLTVNLNSDSSNSPDPTDSSLTIVVLGNVSLRLTGPSSTLINVTSGTVQFGGITFLGSAGSHAELENSELVQSDSEFADIHYSRSLFTIGIGDQVLSDLTAASETRSGSEDEAIPSASSQNTHDSSSAAELQPLGSSNFDTQSTISDLAPASSSSASSANLLERASDSFYSLEFQIASSSQWLFVTGLRADDVTQIENWLTSPLTSASDRASLNGLFLDAEKSLSNTDDDLMCWAASNANMLWFTGWANESLAWDENGDPLFQNEDDVFEYFCEHFADEGGHAYYGSEWFITGNYSAPTTDGWSVEEVDGGGFYAGDYSIYGIRDLSNSVTAHSSYCTLQDIAEYLHDGWAIGLGAASPSFAHAITCWGYVRDTQYDETDPLHYVAILTTDSDDGQTSSAEAALNRLWLTPLSWNASTREFTLVNYSNMTLINYAALAPYSSKVDLSTQNAGSLSHESIGTGDSLSIFNVPVTASSKESSHAFTISVYASADDSISADSDLLLGEFKLDGIAKGNTE